MTSLAVFLFLWFGYKKAKDTGRNGILWAFIASGTFIGTHLIVRIVFEVGIAFSIGFFCYFSEGFSNDCSQSESLFNNLWKRYALYINLIALAASFTSGFLVLKYLKEVSHDPDEKR